MDQDTGKKRKVKRGRRFQGLILEPVLPWLEEIAGLPADVAAKLTTSFLDLIHEQGEDAKAHYMAAVLRLDTRTFLTLLERYIDDPNWGATAATLLSPDDRIWLEQFLDAFSTAEREILGDEP
ncbi:MAG: hypothetical protein HY689_04680 [Chloroflexi bacterium]|nr:hypothetical protein [Chloroflexota bacterium]